MECPFPGMDPYIEMCGLWDDFHPNFVEIDLLRGGQRFPMAEPYPSGVYFVSVARMSRPGRWQVWPIRLQDALPTVPVPLWPGDADVQVDLAPFVSAIYARSNYALSINYSLSPIPPLPADDEGWLDRLLRQQGLREG